MTPPLRGGREGLPFIDFILFGNIYVALGTVCLVQSSVIQLQYTDHLYSYSLLVFFATLFVYNFQRIFYKSSTVNNISSIRRKWILKNKATIKLLTVIGFIGVAATFFLNDYMILFYLSPLLILSLLYFLPFSKLRKNPFFKLLTLAIAWTVVTVLIPILLYNSETVTKNNLLLIFSRFCFMMAICIPFDIRDLEIDKADSISTLPLLIGENIARWLALGFMLAYSFLMIPEYTLGIINLKMFLVLLVSSLVSGAMVLMSNSKRSEYYYTAGIDGTMVLQGVLLMAVNYL